MADFLGLMKQAAQLQSKMQAMQAELDQIEVEGTAGGGVVTVTLSAKGDLKGVKIDDSMLKPSEKEIVEDLLTLETALTRLESVDPRAAQVVSLRFFSGLSSPEVAEHLGVSLRTVEADWTHARAWLKREMSGVGE